MTTRQSKRFLKAFHAASPRLQQKIRERAALFLSSPDDPRLNLHPLKGELNGLWSINVTGDVRIWICYEDDGILFTNVGTHSQLY